jgi:glutaminyl-tRNA synthetase
MTEAIEKPRHFIAQIIAQDHARGREILTRFPPEPNGYLHIGHAKALVLNFEVARAFGGHTHLRFDDTNPEKESAEFVEAIKRDIEWLGYQWHGPVHFASSYFERLYETAVRLIQEGKAFVCELDAGQQRTYRGTLTAPGINSPWRDRPVQENLDLFARMKAGEIAPGSMVLRARIDMASPNMNMRDPVLYRVMDVVHHQAGQWYIYPMYDFAHPLSDAFEGITHSLCSLEFEDHRPLYDWVVEAAGFRSPDKPRQIEFGRLNLAWTVTSKRTLKQLVDAGVVDGWNDPRMPTLSGLRRRGVPAGAIRQFCEAIGVTKSDGLVDMAMLEFAMREVLDRKAPRAMCVLRPLKVTISNYDPVESEILTLPGHPKDEGFEARQLQFERQVFIDAEDFRESANKKFKRLVLGGEVRLRGGYVIRADEVISDDTGQPVEIICSYDPDTLGRNPEGRKVRGVIHWVPASTALKAEVRVYDRLFNVPQPDAGNIMTALNPDSLRVYGQALIEPSLVNAPVGETWQFEREGYFTRDSQSGDRLVFNRTIGLRDTWAGKGGA